MRAVAVEGGPVAVKARTPLRHIANFLAGTASVERPCPAVTRGAETEPRVASIPEPPAPRHATHGAVRRACLIKREVRTGVRHRRDLLGALIRPDSELRGHIEREIFQHVLAVDVSSVDVSVTGGVVTMAGSLPYRSEVVSAGQLAAEIVGTVSVRNRLSYRWDDTRD